jgi:uncharacterized membrane protein YkvA (DUF1232 family)
MPEGPTRHALITRSDFRRHLAAKSGEIAPSDVVALLAQASQLRAKAKRDGRDHPLLATHVETALGLLEDHAAARCPQIPYHTVAVLAAALFYYVDPVDVVPDFLPKVGTSDDGLMLEMAFRLAAPGIERYRAWRDMGAPERHDALPPVPAAARKARPAPRP